MATEMIKTNVNGQWNILLPKHRALREEWNIEKGGWEKERLNSIFENTKNGGIFYYVGGEEMDMCGLISMFGCKLVIIEPNEKVFPNGKAIFQANYLQNPLSCFVGFAANENDFRIDDLVHDCFPKCADGEIISDHGFKELHHGENISKIKIDYLVELTGYIPDFISCDTEGSEWEVLRGAEQTLRKHKPIIWLSIHPEFMFANWNEYSADLRRWIKNIGYTETILDYQHELHVLYLPA